MAGEDDPPRKKVTGILFGFGDFTVNPEEEAATAIEFGPGFDEMFKAGVDAARELKEEAVTNGPEDIPAIATALMPHGAFQLPIEEMCNGMGIRPPEALAIALQTVTSALGQPIAVIMLLETLYKHVEPKEERPPHEPGSYARRWDAGDREGLGEALVVTFATSTTYRSEFMPYHYGDGSVVWDEGSTTDIEGWPDNPESSGNVEEAIAVAFRQEGGTDGTG